MFSTAARNATNREREAGPRAESQYDVIVVGAGVAGLEAARSLVQNYGLKVKVLEARHNVGGVSAARRRPRPPSARARWGARR